MADADENVFIDLILRARDNTAEAFASANANAAVFQRKLEEHEQQNRRNADEFEKSAQRISATQKQAKDDLDKLAEGNRGVLNAQREVEASARRVAQVQADATASDRDRLAVQLQLIDATKNLNKVRNDEAADKQARSLVNSYQDQLKGINSVADAQERVNAMRARANRLDEESLQNNSRAAKDQADRLRAQANEIENKLRLNAGEKQSIRNATELIRVEAERSAQLDRQRTTLRDLEGAAQRYSKAFDSREVIRHREELERHAKTLRDLGHDAQNVQKLLDQAFDSRKVEQLRRGTENLTSAQKDLIRQTEVYQKKVEEISRLEKDRREANRRGLAATQAGAYNALVRDIKRATDEAEKLGASIKAATGNNIDIEVDVDTGKVAGKIITLEALKTAAGSDVSFNVDVDMAAAIAKLRLFNSIKENAAKPPSGGNGLLGFFRTLGRQFDSSSSKIATFDNYLRGLASLGVVVFLNQIIVAAGALGSALLALGSSAVSAAGALGGSLVAALGQVGAAAGPAIAAVVSLRGIFKAVQQDQLLQQQQFGKTADTAKKVADATDAAAVASENLTDANDRVRDAQEGIIQARARAITQLRDLILQEKEAELAAKGANLSLEESRDRLAQAQASGDTGAIARARLDVQSSQLGTRRASNDLSDTRAEVKSRRASGVDGSPEVKSAIDQLESAEKSARGAERALKKAKETAEESGDASLAAADKLQYMLSKMSDSERALYQQITQFVETFGEVGPKIAEPLLDSFTRAMEKINGLLKNNDFIATLTELSEKMSDAFDKVFDHFSSGEYGDAFEFFADEAGKNMDTLADIISNVGDIFIRLGRAAAPALAELLKYVERLSKRWADFLATEAGQKKTTDFLNKGVDQFKLWIGLLGSIGKLFGTIMSGGGLKEGENLLKSLTDNIDEFNEKLKSDEGQKKLAEFFEVTKGALVVLGTILSSLANAFTQLFTPEGVENLKALAEIINEILVPALVNILEVLGSVSRALGEFFENNPFAAKVAEIAITGALLAGVGSKVIAVFAPFGRVLALAGTALSRFGPLIVSLGARFAALGAYFTETAALIASLGTRFSRVGALFARLGPILTRFGGLVTRVGLMVGRAVTLMFGPFGIAVAVVVGILIYLQKRFDIFGKAWRAVSELVSDVGQWVGRKLSGALNAIKRFLNNAIEFVRNNAGKIADWVKTAVSDIGQFFTDAFKGAKEAVVNGFDSVIGFFEGFGDRAGKALSGLGDIISSVFKGAINLGIGILNKGIEGINKIFGPREIFGVKTPGIKIGKLDKLQSGAYVKGNYAEGDKYPALLAGDEAVLNPMQMAMIGRDRIMNVLRRTGAQVIGQGNGSYATGAAPKSSAGGKSSSGSTEELIIDLGHALQIIQAFGKVAYSAWDRVWDRLTTRARQGRNSVTAVFETMYTRIDNTQDQIGKRLVNGWKNIREQVSKDSKGLRTDIQDTMQSVKSSVYDGMKYVANATNTVLKGFDAEPVTLSIEAPAKQRAATGFLGQQGERGGDAIPIMVGRGEAVLNWAHQKMIEPALRAYYGTGLADLFDRTHAYHAGGPQAMGMPGFAKGGFTGPFGSGEGFNAIANFAKRKFGLTMTAGKDNHSLLTASNNISDHSRGTAGDFSNGSAPTPQMDAFNSFWKNKLPQTVKQLIWRNKDQFRGFPVPDHMNHVHLAVKDPYAFNSSLIAKLVSRKMRGLSIEDLLAGVAGDGASVEHIEAPKVKGQKGSLRTIVQKALSKVTKAANRHLDTAFGSSAVGGVGASDYTNADAGIDGGQKGIVQTAANVAKRLGASGKVLLAAVEAGIVESGLRNLPYGDRDSVGVLQQRPSQGWKGLNNVPRAFAEFISRAIPLANKYGTAGRLAQAVQRSGYPERYDQVRGRAIAALKSAGIPGFARGGFVGGMRRAATGYMSDTPRGRQIDKKNYYIAPDAGIPEGDLAGTTAEYNLAIQTIKNAVRKIKSVGAQTNRVSKSLTLITREGGLLDQIQTGIQSTIDGAARRLASSIFKINKAGDVSRRISPEQELEEISKNMVDALKLMKSQARRISNRYMKNIDVLNDAEDRIGELEEIDPKKRTKKEKAELKKLKTDVSDINASQVALKKEAEEMQQAIADQLAAIYQQQMDAFSQSTEKALTNAKSSAGNNTATIAALQRKATAMGRGAELNDLAEQSIQAMQSQQNILRGALNQANARGYTDLADQYRTQLEELDASIVEATATRLQTAIDAVNTAATRSLAGIDRRLSSADLLERVGGDQSLLGKLNGTLGTNFGTGTGLALKGGALADQANVLAGQKSQLQQLLNAAAQQGNLGAVDSLTDALADLDKTIGENIIAQAENTTAIRQSAIDAIASRTQFQTGVFGGLSGLVSAVGSANSTPADQDRLRGLLGQTRDTTRRSLNENADLLSGFGVDVRGKTGIDLVDALKNVNFEGIAAGLSPGDKTQFETLTNAVISNATELENNTQQLNELNGGQQLQGFTSSAWSFLRTAIFDGMGNTLPSYTLPSVDSGGPAISNAMSQMQPGDSARAASLSSLAGMMPVQEGDVNITVNEAGQPTDANYLARQAAFARRASRGTR